MLETPISPTEALRTLREVRTIEDPAVHRLVASASVLADLVEKMSREHAWS